MKLATPTAHTECGFISILKARYGEPYVYNVVKVDGTHYRLKHPLHALELWVRKEEVIIL